MTSYPTLPPFNTLLSPLGASALGVWSGSTEHTNIWKCRGRWPFDATVTPNGTGVTRISGAFGHALHFAASGYLSVDVPTQAKGASNWNPYVGTFVVWFRTSVTPGANHAWITGRASSLGSNSGIWFLMLQDTSLVFNVANVGQGSSSAQVVTGTGYNDGLWHMAACVFSQSNSSPQRLYVDGRLIGSATSDTNNWSISTNTIRWAKSLDSFWGLFDGDIDPGAWFARELTASEIANLYRTGPAGFFRVGTSPEVLSAAASLVGSLARISQLGVLSVDQGTPAARVSQLGVLSVDQGTPAARVSQLGVLSVVTYPKVRVSQTGVLAIDQGAPKVRVSQTGVLAIDQGAPKVRVSQTGVLMIVPAPSTGAVPAAILPAM